MKAEDLMIGDYVIRKNVPKEILIVDIIDSIGDIVYLDLDGLGITEKIENVEPIPLTQKILEKNGFEYIRFGYIEKEETRSLEPIHQWRLENSRFALDDDSWWRGKLHVKFGGFQLEYVHQLQHALRLCNISKEIKI